MKHQPVQRQPGYKIAQKEERRWKKKAIDWGIVLWSNTHNVLSIKEEYSHVDLKMILVIDGTDIRMYKTCDTTHTNSYENSIQNKALYRWLKLTFLNCVYLKYNTCMKASFTVYCAFEYVNWHKYCMILKMCLCEVVDLSLYLFLVH